MTHLCCDPNGESRDHGSNFLSRLGDGRGGLQRSMICFIWQHLFTWPYTSMIFLQVGCGLYYESH
jgi:hypothetical protein